MPVGLTIYLNKSTIVILTDLSFVCPTMNICTVSFKKNKGTINCSVMSSLSHVPFLYVCHQVNKKSNLDTVNETTL